MERRIYSPFEKESGLSEQEKEFYYLLVLAAKEAKAYPHQSGYFVKTAGMTESGEMYLGGNKEYAMSDAFVHGETAVISGLRDLTESPVRAIAWYRREDLSVDETSFGCPCGNCRDVMRAYCDPDLVLLNGNENGVVYTRLRDFLFEDFAQINPEDARPYQTWLALSAARRGVDIYLPELLKKTIYGAALIGEDGSYWQGVHYSNAGYDAVTPVMSAVLSWMNSYPGGISKKHLNLKKLVIAGDGTTPDPFYRDRQAILELDEILRLFTGRTEPLTVEIIQARDSKSGYASADKVFVTNTEEWLPHPFTPGAFRMDDVMVAQLTKIVGIREAEKLMRKR